VNEIVDQLIAVVAEEAEHCERTLTLLRQQQRRLIEGDTEGIENNVREQETAIRRSRELERRRLTLLERLAATEDFGGEAPDMERLITTLSDDYGRRLTQLRESLLEAIQRIAKVKQQNAMLIERSLSNIGETVRLLAMLPGAGGHTIDASGRPVAAMPLSVDRLG
jgi:flagellar biosynthesis/type III secretory pathway chaperone